jgi:hypothetical protein
VDGSGYRGNNPGHISTTSISLISVELGNSTSASRASAMGIVLRKGVCRGHRFRIDNFLTAKLSIWAHVENSAFGVGDQLPAYRVENP